MPPAREARLQAKPPKSPRTVLLMLALSELRPPLKRQTSGSFGPARKCDDYLDPEVEVDLKSKAAKAG